MKDSHLPGGLPEVVSSTPLSGGSIARTVAARLSDGRQVVVKHTSYDARLEADGLEALAEAGAPVPAVLGVSPDVLVIEHVHGTPDWRGLGATLAEVHASRHRAGHAAEAFGWHQDNVIGSLPQANPPTEAWPEFYAEHRIRPWLRGSALPAPVTERLRAALDGPLQRLLDHDAAASLVHGDLWSGNVVDGAYLVDPAVHHADREFELAFADLFGGFPGEFWSAYQQAWPLDDGWERRRPALQLYHLLVHVELFGRGYVSSVVDRLDRLGW